MDQVSGIGIYVVSSALIGKYYFKGETKNLFLMNMNRMKGFTLNK